MVKNVKSSGYIDSAFTKHPFHLLSKYQFYSKRLGKTLSVLASTIHLLTGGLNRLWMYVPLTSFLVITILSLSISNVLKWKQHIRSS